jgi:hypothetical protein
LGRTRPKAQRGLPAAAEAEAGAQAHYSVAGTSTSLTFPRRLPAGT